jgi:hypothetical protein
VLELGGWSLQNAIRRFALPQAEDLKYKFFEACFFRVELHIVPDVIESIILFHLTPACFQQLL